MSFTGQSDAADSPGMLAADPPLTTLVLALWLAFTDHAVMAGPSAIVIAGLVRTYVRELTGKQFQPSEMTARPRYKS